MEPYELCMHLKRSWTVCFAAMEELTYPDREALQDLGYWAAALTKQVALREQKTTRWCSTALITRSRGRSPDPVRLGSTSLGSVSPRTVRAALLHFHASARHRPVRIGGRPVVACRCGALRTRTTRDGQRILQSRRGVIHVLGNRRSTCAVHACSSPWDATCTCTCAILYLLSTGAAIVTSWCLLCDRARPEADAALH